MVDASCGDGGIDNNNKIIMLSTILFALSVLFFVSGVILRSVQAPAGELGLWYHIETCQQSTAEGGWARHSLRGAVAADEFPGMACRASEAGTARPIDITLEQEDGLRTDSLYRSTLKRALRAAAGSLPS